jgi:hypothetical protein
MLSQENANPWWPLVDCSDAIAVDGGSTSKRGIYNPDAMEKMKNDKQVTSSLLLFCLISDDRMHICTAHYHLIRVSESDIHTLVVFVHANSW